MSFKFSLLNDQEFDSLPGKDIREAVGVSYPEKGEAYIRKSGSTIMDAFTIAHELEHLQGSDLDEEFDKEGRCYYKKASGWNPFGGDFLDFGNSLNLHPLILPAAEAVAGAFGGPLASTGVGAAYGAAHKGETNYDTGEKGQPGGLGGALMGGLQGFGMGGLGASLGGGLNGLSAGGGLSDFGKGLSSGAGNYFSFLGGGGGGGTGGAEGSAVTPGGPSSGGGLKGIGGLLGNNFLGNGLLSLFQPKPQQQASPQMQNPYSYTPPPQSSQDGPNVYQVQNPYGGQSANQDQYSKIYGRQM